MATQLGQCSAVTHAHRKPQIMHTRLLVTHHSNKMGYIIWSYIITNVCTYVACLTADKTDMRYHIYVRNTCIRMCCVQVRTYECTYMYPILLLWSVTNRRVCMICGLLWVWVTALHCHSWVDTPVSSSSCLLFPYPFIRTPLYIFYSPPFSVLYVHMWIKIHTYNPYQHTDAAFHQSWLNFK